MSNPPTIALRFQRAELEKKAELSPEGLAILAQSPHPTQFLDRLQAAGLDRDAVYALAMMLPHRQAVWWACLALRLLPDLDARGPDAAAVDVAERWVQSGAAGDAEQAGTLAETCNPNQGPAWAANACFWAGPSLAPRGQQPVPPAPHLPGVAARIALLLLRFEPSMTGRADYRDWLEIGLALMRGENGRQAQATVRNRIFAS